MNDLHKKRKFEDFENNWSPEEDIEVDDDTVQDIEEESEEEYRTPHRRRPLSEPRPPRAPPLPPLPPLPPDIEILKSDKVIGIRGLDAQLYKDISRIARKNGVSVAELINRILAKYRYTSIGENGNTISNIDSLELFEEDLTHLDDEGINIIGVKNLSLGADVTHESFNKIRNIEHIEHIWVPPHLYLPLVKKARNCHQIEKYKGDKIPRVIQKSFDSDVHLTKSFFEYFLDEEQMVDLTVYGELRIDTDVSLDDFKSVIYNLRVDNDIQAPRHLIGFLFAKSKCYGEIEEIED
ncbi:MAG: hypothetical protein JSW11_16190 [Candidatus Heimdallarchaeota archaeon]|nr:MAG: hypothetical protein JSW11_16190 [Candidatus Heimdallarchaeota archaeon]